MKNVSIEINGRLNVKCTSDSNTVLAWLERIVKINGSNNEK